MRKETTIDQSVQNLAEGKLKLPLLPGVLESTLSKGNLLQIDGTNVVRVPFGIRQSRKERPAKPPRMATLVLPLNPSDSPTPPPQAA